ncbi:hypothetical protein IFM5058_03266 [Aspergillus udagawae]|nr:hypothetical protein IFM5058_03266 [Aspergillus udagawae]
MDPLHRLLFHAVVPLPGLAQEWGLLVHIIHRDKFVDELIARVRYFLIVRVRGTPASGHVSKNLLLRLRPPLPRSGKDAGSVEISTKGIAGPLCDACGRRHFGDCPPPAPAASAVSPPVTVVYNVYGGVVNSFCPPPTTSLVGGGSTAVIENFARHVGSIGAATQLEFLALIDQLKRRTLIIKVMLHPEHNIAARKFDSLITLELDSMGVLEEVDPLGSASTKSMGRTRYYVR